MRSSPVLLSLGTIGSLRDEDCRTLDRGVEPVRPDQTLLHHAPHGDDVLGEGRLQLPVDASEAGHHTSNGGGILCQTEK